MLVGLADNFGKALFPELAYFTLYAPMVLILAVKPTGCSGYMYVVEMTKQVQDQDQVFESHGVPVVVDAQSLKYLEGTEVDFTREGLNEGFRFANPNVAATCGCGESFTV